MVESSNNENCVLIDVGDPIPVLNLIQSIKKIPRLILTTHKHWLV